MILKNSFVVRGKAVAQDIIFHRSVLKPFRPVEPGVYQTNLNVEDSGLISLQFTIIYADTQGI